MDDDDDGIIDEDRLGLDTIYIQAKKWKPESTVGRPEIQKFVEAKTAEMDEMRKEFESLKNQLSVQGSKLTDEARADLEYQITTKETQIQRFQQDTQGEINNRRDRATSYIIKRLQFVIDKVAREKGFAAVMVLRQDRDAWIDPSLDITEEMVKAYNAEYPVTAAKEPLTP